MDGDIEAPDRDSGMEFSPKIFFLGPLSPPRVKNFQGHRSKYFFLNFLHKKIISEKNPFFKNPIFCQCIGLLVGHSISKNQRTIIFSFLVVNVQSWNNSLERSRVSASTAFHTAL